MNVLYGRIVRGFALAAALLLGACSNGSGEPPLQGARLGGPFVLTDQSGRTVRDSDFQGQYRLIYFGYSFCPDICPTDLQSIGRALTRFEKEDPERAKRIQPIFITVDPERDTPAVLKKYAAAFHPRLLGLTGTEEQIAAVKKDYGIASSKQDSGDSENYLVDHARLTTLFGPQGQPISFVPSDEGVDAVIEVLDKWVK